MGLQVQKGSEFQKWVSDWLGYLYEEFPALAAADGIHENDDRLGGYEREQLERVVSRLKSFAERLQNEVHRGLAAGEEGDYQVAQTHLQRWIWNLETYRQWACNPQYYVYLVCSPLMTQLLFPWAPLEERSRIVTRQLEQIGAVLQAARKNLETSAPIFVRYGKEQFEGTFGLLERDIPLAFAQVKDDQIQRKLRAAADAALAQVKDFVRFLDTDLGPRSKMDFALGRDQYRELLDLGESVQGEPEFYAELAEREIERAHTRWENLARRIDANRSPEDLWHRLHQDHPEGGTLPRAAEDQLDELRRFLAERDVLPVPDRLQIQVLPTPEFFRWSFASMWTPGAFEKTPMKSTYYITDVLPEWTEEQKKQHLAGYSFGDLWMITIHEVFPGHGVQLAWLPDVDSPLRKSSLVGSTAYIEGWAHYAEELMVEIGFTERDLRIEVGQIAEALTRLCRTVASIRMHLKQMTLDEAAKFFVEKGWLSEQSARREAERGTFDPSYCLYTIGKWQLLGLRHLVRKEKKQSFSLADFHSKVLKGGFAPWPIYQQELLTKADNRKADLIRVFAEEVAPSDPRERWK